MTHPAPPADLLELLHEAVTTFGDRDAVIHDDETLSYRELYGRASRVARALGRLPERDARIVLAADNGPIYATLYWGILMAGHTTVELDPSLGQAELSRRIVEADPSLVVADARLAGALSASGLAPHGDPIRVCSCPVWPAADASRIAADLGDAVASPNGGATPAGLHEPRPEAVASIVYTSGTTGRVKGVCLSHASLAWATAAIARSFGLSRAADERFSGFLPLFHTYGKSVLHLAAWCGSPIVFTALLPSPRNLLDVVDQSGITHLSLVPYHVNRLLELPRFSSEHLPRVRRVTVSGDVMGRRSADEMLRRFPDRFVPMYGLTESSTRLTCMPASRAATRPLSCGLPLDGVEVAIFDDEDAPLAPGSTGEVRARGPNVMQGYFRDAAASRHALRDGWLCTGDLGSRDDEGYLFITGRRKDIVNVMGESVSAWNVEETISELPVVAEAAVIGVPDEVVGEAIVAFVVGAPGHELDAEAIRRHCASRLGRLRVPARVHMVEELPRTASGKVRKHLLSEPEASGR